MSDPPTWIFPDNDLRKKLDDALAEILRLKKKVSELTERLTKVRKLYVELKPRER